MGATAERALERADPRDARAAALSTSERFGGLARATLSSFQRLYGYIVICDFEEIPEKMGD